MSEDTKEGNAAAPEESNVVDVFDEIHAVATCLGKSENLRVSAGVRYAELSKLVHSPGNDAAQQLIEAGYEPTNVGIWLAVVADPSYPREMLGDSPRTGERLLALGRSGDPMEALKLEQERNRRRKRNGGDTVTKPDGGVGDCNSKSAPPPPPSAPPREAPVAPDREPVYAAPAADPFADAADAPILEELKDLFEKLSPASRRAFAEWAAAENAIDSFMHGKKVERRSWSETNAEVTR